MSDRREQANQLRERLREYYCKPGEVRPGVVFATEINAPHSNRRADAVAVHLTKARPWIDGIEIKVDRADWLAELADHTKADGWFPHTHRWWIAAPSPAVIPPHEVPEGWGLMVANPRSKRLMTTLVKPAVRQPELSFPVLVEILKKVDNQRAEHVADTVQHIEHKVHADLEARYESQLAHAREQVANIDQRHDRDLGQLLRQATGDTSQWQLRAALQDPEITRLLADLVAATGTRAQTRRMGGDLRDAARRHEAAASALRSAAEAVGAVWSDAS